MTHKGLLKISVLCCTNSTQVIILDGFVFCRCGWRWGGWDQRSGRLWRQAERLHWWAHTEKVCPKIMAPTKFSLKCIALHMLPLNGGATCLIKKTKLVTGSDLLAMHCSHLLLANLLPAPDQVLLIYAEKRSFSQNRKFLFSLIRGCNRRSANARYMNRMQNNTF